MIEECLDDRERARVLRSQIKQSKHFGILQMGRPGLSIPTSQHYHTTITQNRPLPPDTNPLLNSLFIITLRAGGVPPGDSLEFPAKRHGAGSRC
jgi:hypothetical protein